MNVDPKALSDADRDALLRWRLALGPEAERALNGFGLGGLGGLAGLDGERLSDLDGALEFVYGSGKQGGRGGSAPYIPKWLGALREFFSHDVVALVQRDAIERKGLTQLLFEPETLPFLEKNVDLVATLISAKGLIPDEAKTIARQVVREVVDELRKKLESEVRTAIVGALRRDKHSPLKVLRNMDFRRTIRSNLKGWDTKNKRIIPERLYFWANQRRHHEWNVSILVDQSGSMGQSVVYSSVMAAIFASLNVLKTRLAFFDTEIVDVTHLLVDPVDVIFATQLGGGTDINRAVAYAEQNFFERPEKTIFILITDLFEGGNADEMLARIRRIVESRAKTICLLALSDGGKPSYDHENARKLAELGVPCFGCTPKLLVRVMEKLMRGEDISSLLTEPQHA
jgi:VWA domain containing CoxE-like protein